jgi:hypothetical protein
VGKLEVIAGLDLLVPTMKKGEVRLLDNFFSQQSGARLPYLLL